MGVLGLRVGLLLASGGLKFWTSDVTVAFRSTLERMGFLLVGFCDGVMGRGATAATGCLSRSLGWLELRVGLQYFGDHSDFSLWSSEF